MLSRNRKVLIKIGLAICVLSAFSGLAYAVEPKTETARDTAWCRTLRHALRDPYWYVWTWRTEIPTGPILTLREVTGRPILEKSLRQIIRYCK